MRQKKKLDAYIVEVYPEEHPKYTITQFDTLEWLHQFSKSRPLKNGKKYNKGFIELNFE